MGRRPTIVLLAILREVTISGQFQTPKRTEATAIGPKQPAWLMSLTNYLQN